MIRYDVHQMWNMPSTLCTYFWALIGGIVGAFVIGLTVTGIPVALWSKFSSFEVANADLWLLIWIGFGALGSIGLFLLCCILACIMLVVSIDWIKTRYQQWSHPEEFDYDAEPNPVTEWFRARKEKICPIIEYQSSPKGGGVRE